MGFRTAVARLLTGDETEAVVECRQCGTTVAPDTDQCPECGSGEFGTYRITE